MADDRAGRPELRLALGMRGGVSLAIWIGGACAEIDDLRRAADYLDYPDRFPGDVPEGIRFWAKELATSDYRRVVVDVMAGASAGGLNGVLFGAAIRHGFSMGDLLDVWNKVGGIDKLVRTDAPWMSVLDGDAGFLDEIRANLFDLVGKAQTSGSIGAGPETYLDLQLSATLVEPLEVAATSPNDERLRSRRSSARFQFRHDTRAAQPSRSFEVEEVPCLSVAARATASFPIAFEAAVVRSSRSSELDLAGGSRPQPPAAMADDVRLPDCRGVFSESRGDHEGRARYPELHQDDFVVADGGIVDNIPLGKALQAIRDAPAHEPTSRCLIYLHPTGPVRSAVGSASASTSPVDPPTALDRRGPRAVGQGMVAARIESESIDGDLDQLEDHNRRVRLARSVRRSMQTKMGQELPSAFADGRLASYLELRAGVDADGLCGLLGDPLGTLGEDPFPIAAGPPPDDVQADDRWRAPLAGWKSDARESLDGDLRAAFETVPADSGLDDIVLQRGVWPLLRCTTLLLEWVRSLETHTRKALDRASDDVRRGKLELALKDQHAAKEDLYWYASLLRSMERVREIGWVISAGSTWGDNTVSHGDQSAITGWVDGTVPFLEDLFRVRDVVAVVVLGPDRYPTGQQGVSPAQEALEAHLDECAEVLQLLVDRRSSLSPADIAGALAYHYAPSRGEHTRLDLRVEIMKRLESVLRQVTRFAASVPVDAVEDAGLLHQVMREKKVSFARRLAVLEVLCLQEHAIGSPGGDDIDFRRMSAAAPTIGARGFEVLHEWSSKQYPHLTAEHLLAPNVKLAGNEIGSFSAFLDPRWRTNDWYWGRMDAVPTLLTLLHGKTDEGLLEDEILRSKVQERQGQIWSEAERTLATLEEGDHKSAPTAATWAVGLETLQMPGRPSLVRSTKTVARAAASVAATAMGPSAPPVSGVLRSLAAVGAGRFARPQGWPAQVPAVGGRTSAEGSSRSTAKLGLVGGLIGLFAVFLAVTVAGAVYAVNDSVWSFIPGIGVGLAVSSVVALFGVVLTLGTPGSWRSRLGWVAVGGALASLASVLVI